MMMLLQETVRLHEGLLVEARHVFVINLLYAVLNRVAALRVDILEYRIVGVLDNLLLPCKIRGNIHNRKYIQIGPQPVICLLYPHACKFVGLIHIVDLAQPAV